MGHSGNPKGIRDPSGHGSPSDGEGHAGPRNTDTRPGERLQEVSAASALSARPSGRASTLALVPPDPVQHPPPGRRQEPRGHAGPDLPLLDQPQLDETRYGYRVGLPAQTARVAAAGRQGVALPAAQEKDGGSAVGHGCVHSTVRHFTGGRSGLGVVASRS